MTPHDPSRLRMVVEPEEVNSAIGSGSVVLVDLREREDYLASHVPGAVHLASGAIVSKRPPVGGLLPDEAVLVEVLGKTGIGADMHVVAYDDEGGGWAGRLIWTLDVIGHSRASLLNGGWRAWSNEGYPAERGEVTPPRRTYPVRVGDEHRVTTEYILQNLSRLDIAWLDTRTPEEYRGEKRLAARGGHIPGAVNIDWSRLMDPSRNLRLKPESELRDLLAAHRVTPDKEVIVYCQTHHRSSLTYVALRALDYPRVKGYPGAWSDWGNRADTPIET